MTASEVDILIIIIAEIKTVEVGEVGVSLIEVAFEVVTAKSILYNRL